jgi:hypothetical protein
MKNELSDAPEALWYDANFAATKKSVIDPERGMVGSLLQALPADMSMTCVQSREAMADCGHQDVCRLFHLCRV